MDSDTVFDLMLYGIPALMVAACTGAYAGYLYARVRTLESIVRGLIILIWYHRDEIRFEQVEYDYLNEIKNYIDRTAGGRPTIYRPPTDPPTNHCSDCR